MRLLLVPIRTLVVAFLLALQTFTPDALELPLIGPVTGMHQLLGWASFLFMIGLSVFLMVPVAALFSGLFLDDIAAAVEDRHYDFLPPVPPPGRAASWPSPPCPGRASGRHG